MHMIAMLMKRMYWFQEAMQHAFVPNGITPLTRAQSLVVGNIVAGENKASNIAQNLGVSRQAISQTLAELESAGFIEQCADPHDKRSRIVKLSSHFAENGGVCVRIFEALEQELEQRIGKRKFANLRDSLEAEWGEPPRIGAVGGRGRRKLPTGKQNRTSKRSGPP